MARKVVLALFLFVLAAPASVAGPLYVGASYGNTALEIDTPDVDFDADDPSFKVFAGLRFLKFFGVEASYLDLGSPTDGSVTIETTGWSGFAMGVLPLGPVGLFAKVGAVATDTSITEALDESSTDPAYGVGAEFSFSKLSIRAEYERFELEDTDALYMVSVGAALRF